MNKQLQEEGGSRGGEAGGRGVMLAKILNLLDDSVLVQNGGGNFIQWYLQLLGHAAMVDMKITSGISIADLDGYHLFLETARRWECTVRERWYSHCRLFIWTISCAQDRIWCGIHYNTKHPILLSKREQNWKTNKTLSVLVITSLHDTPNIPYFWLWTISSCCY